MELTDMPSTTTSLSLISNRRWKSTTPATSYHGIAGSPGRTRTRSALSVATKAISRYVSVLLLDHQVPTPSRLELTNAPVLGLAKICLRASRLSHLRRQRNKSRWKWRKHPPRRPCNRGPRQRPTSRAPSWSRRRFRADRPLCEHECQSRTRVRNQWNDTRP
jgi:hypothetical protein